MTAAPYQQTVDVVIIGGGIAGLFIHHRLHTLGIQSVLLEQQQLGGQQTLLSQGIIHGGLKYALTGSLSSETEAIASMPEQWRQLLNGTGPIDLSSAQCLSNTQHLWSSGKLGSRMATFFASKLLRGRIHALKAEQLPTLFQHTDFKGSVYELDDIVLDIHSVLHALLKPVADHTFQLPTHSHIHCLRTAERITTVRVCDHHQHSIAEFKPQHVIFSAGAGNETLLQTIGLQQPAMQRRPLHMLMVKHRQPFDLYAHCIGPSNRPRATITTHPCQDGGRVWYIGGEVAEHTEHSDAEQIQRGQAELQRLLPWIQLPQAQWKTQRIDRAEPRQSNVTKPDHAFLSTQHNITTIWPTKLTLAPDIMQRCEHSLAAWGLKPSTPITPLTPPSPLAKATIATPFWESF